MEEKEMEKLCVGGEGKGEGGGGEQIAGGGG